MSDFLHVITIHQQAYWHCCNRLSWALAEAGIDFMTPEQALLLMRMPAAPTPAMKLSELSFLGSSISYNLQRLTERGFVQKEGKSDNDLRLRLYARTYRGDQLVDFLNEHLNGVDHAAA